MRVVGMCLRRLSACVRERDMKGAITGAWGESARFRLRRLPAGFTGLPRYHDLAERSAASTFKAERPGVTRQRPKRAGVRRQAATRERHHPSIT